MAFPGQIAAITPDPAPDFAPSIPEDERPVSWSSSVYNAFKREYAPRSVLQYLERGNREFEEDPGFNGWKFLADNMDQYRDVLPELEGDLANRVNEAVSEAHLLDNIRLLREEKDVMQKAESNGFLPYLIGGVGGAVLDPMTWAGAALVAKGMQASKMATSLPAWAAVGISGAVEQVGQEFLLHQGQDLRTLGESASAVVLSAAIGAGLAKALGISPVKTDKLMPGDAVKGIVEGKYSDVLDEIIPATPDGLAAHYGRGSVGAAENVVGSEPIKGAGLGAVADLVSPLGRAVRSVREWASYRDAIKPGDVPGPMVEADKAVRGHWALVEQLMDTHLLTKENVAGAPTAISAEAKRNFYRMSLVEARLQIDKSYMGLRKALGQTGIIGRHIDQRAFEQDVFSYRLATEIDKHGSWKPSAKNMQFLPDEKSQLLYRKAVEDSDRAMTKFFEFFKDEEIKYGLLDPKDAKGTYIPHIYNREEITLAPDEFRALLRERFLQQPDDDWIAEWQISRMPDDPEGTATPTTKSWDELSPAEKEEAIVDWEAEIRGKAEQFAEELAAEAQRAIDVKSVHLKELRAARGPAGRARVAAQIEEARTTATAKRAELRQKQAAVERRRINLGKDQAKFDAYQTAKPPTGPKALVAWNRRYGRLQGLVEEGNRWLAARNNEIAALQKELNDLEFRIARSSSRLQSAKLFDDIVARAERQTAKAIKKAKGDLKRAARLEKKTAAKLSLDERVDAVFDAITNAKIAPYGRLPQDVVEKSGRMRQRQINWGSMLKDPRLHRFLHLEPHRVLQSYAEDMGSRLAIVSNFGEESMETALRGARAGYDRAIEAATEAGNKELAERLIKYRKRLIDDMPTLRDQFLGRLRLGDNPNTTAMWWSKELRNLNYLRAMGKVLVSSITDPVTTMLATNTNLKQYAKALVTNVSLWKKIPSQELKRLIEGFEVSLTFNRQTLAYGLDDTHFTPKGFGTGGVRRATEKIDEFLTTGTSVMGQWSGINLWNRHIRHIGGQLFIGKAYQDLPKFGSLDPKAKAKWLRLGVDDAWADRIAKLMDDSDTVDGIKLPRAENWQHTDPEAYRVFAMSMSRVLDEALVVPGLGDLPFFMSTQMGKLLMQFQGFNYATTNRYARPLMQGIFGLHEYSLITNTVLGAGLGLLSYTARMALAGKLDTLQSEYSLEDDADFAKLLYEGVSRSPMLGNLVTPVDLMMKTMASPVNSGLQAMGMPRVIPQPSRIAERSSVASLMGPTPGMIESAFGVITSTKQWAEDNDDEAGRRAIRDLTRLMPYNNLFWLQGAMMNYQRQTGKYLVKPKRKE